MRSNAQPELTEVRRRQKELAEIEAELVVSVDVHSRRIDEALDERLQRVPLLGHQARARSVTSCSLETLDSTPAGSGSRSSSETSNGDVGP